MKAMTVGAVTLLFGFWCATSGCDDTDTDSDGDGDSDTDTSTDECEGFDGREPYIDEAGFCVQCLAGYCDDWPYVCETAFDTHLEEIEEELEETGCEMEGYAVYRCDDGDYYIRQYVIDGGLKFYYGADNAPIGKTYISDTGTYCENGQSENLYLGDTTCEIDCSVLYCVDDIDTDPDYPSCVYCLKN